jgi:peptidoglycan/LPS O-acetylase OafA/YrhL
VDAAASAPESGLLKRWFLRHVARPYPAQEFVPQIDGLRCIAIMAVLLYHVQGFVMIKSGAALGSEGLLQRILGEGSFGVPLFFAISGYILCRPFLGGRDVSLKRYFIRRLTRLEPPYLISLGIVFVAKVALLGVVAGELFPNLMASLFYSHNLIYGEHSEVNGVTWSLEIEWQFYLLAPLIFSVVAAARERSRHALLLVLAIAGGWAYVACADVDARIALSLIRYFGFFAAGTWVAVLDQSHAQFGRNSLGFDALGLLAWTAVGWILLEAQSLMGLLPALTAVLLLTGIRGRIFSRVLGWWPVYCIGAMCYTIYLYHFFIVSALGKLLAASVGWPASTNFALLAFGVVAVPVVVAACLLPYLLIERPFMVWRPGRNRLGDAFRELRS